MAWASVKIPNTFSGYLSGSFLGGELTFDASLTQGLRYALTKPGCFLEGDFEYDWNLRGPLSFQLWAKGSWLRIRGRGTMDANENLSVIVNGAQLFSGSSADSDDATATYTRYAIGGGIGATWTF